MNDLKVSSKTGVTPLKNLDPDSGPVPWKKPDPEKPVPAKHPINMGLYFIKIMRNVICCLKVQRYLN